MPEVGYLIRETKLVFTKSVANLKNINKSLKWDLYLHIKQMIYRLMEFWEKKSQKRFLSRYRQVYSKIHMGSHKLIEELKQTILKKH
jgi:uncharacterized protein YukE